MDITTFFKNELLTKEEAQIIKEFLTEEEATAVEKLLKEMRAEKEKEKMIAMYTNIIRYDMEQTLAKLGLAKTKNIMRELIRSLNSIRVGEE